MRHTRFSVTATMLAMAMVLWPPGDAVSQQQREQPPHRQQQGQQADVNRLTEDYVLVRLSDKAWVGGDFSVTARNGTVTLSGTVPSERTKARLLRITRETAGVTEVRDQMRVDPGAASASSSVDDNALSRRVAQQIAAAVPGAKAGEDWWLTGWRVEGEDNAWNFVVESENGQVYLEGEVPRLEIMREAVDAARKTPGVMSVRSDFELERFYARRPYWPYRYGYPYGPYGYAPYGPYGYVPPHIVVDEDNAAPRDDGRRSPAASPGSANPAPRRSGQQ